MLSAPVVAFVDDVVVKQRGRVHELDRSRQADVPIAAIPAQLGRRDGDHGPQPLATRCDQVVRQLRDKIDFGDGLIEDDAVDGLHVGVDQGQQRLQALRSFARFLQGDDDTQDVVSPARDPLVAYNLRQSGPVKPSNPRHICQQQILDAVGTEPQPHMRELLRTNDVVLLSFAEWTLREASIASLVADQHVSAVEGSIGAFPRRLLVGDDDWLAARRLLVQAGLQSWLVAETAEDDSQDQAAPAQRPTRA